MLDVHFVLLGAAVGIVGQARYIYGTIRGRVRPNRVTWLLWGVAPLLAFAAEIDAGVGLRALMTFIVGFGPLLVFGASFIGGAEPWRIRPQDWLCGGLSVVGTATWLLTRHGDVAIAVAIAADLLAGVPTIVKSWRVPESESVSVYAASIVNAGLTVLTVDRPTVADLAFPTYILLWRAS